MFVAQILVYVFKWYLRRGRKADAEFGTESGAEGTADANAQSRAQEREQGRPREDDDATTLVQVVPEGNSKAQ